MDIARTLLPAVTLCAAMLAGDAAAQPYPPATAVEPPSILEPPDRLWAPDHDPRSAPPRVRSTPPVRRDPPPAQNVRPAPRAYDPRSTPPEDDPRRTQSADDPRWSPPAYDRPAYDRPRTDGGYGGYAPNEHLRRLEQALARYRDIESRGGWSKVPTDLAMGPEYSYECSRIAAVERRLVAEGYLRHVSAPPPLPPLPPLPAGRRQPAKAPPPVEQRCRYSRDLTEAMKAFQLDRKVLGYGQVGKLTYAELNRPVHEIVDMLEHDVERWRQVSVDPSGTYLLVNIPFFELIAYEGGQEVLRMPVVVGQKTWQTPLFTDELEYIILNPEWGIPDSIAKQETWPQARRDPNYFRREGITVSDGGLRQKPGPKNPLGRIKFMMPNSHNVYLHDTPGKGAFNAAVRALSHGCIRLGKPMDLAHYLLRDDPMWTPGRLEKAIATGRTQQINLRQRMPVHVVYSTSRVTDDGRVELRSDVYGMNKRAVAASLPHAGEDVDAGP